jgi:hypothetical protein
MASDQNSIRNRDGQNHSTGKAVESLSSIHEAQLLTYLKLGGWKVGLLINFNVSVLENGIRRRVLHLEEQENSGSSASLR